MYTFVHAQFVLGYILIEWISIPNSVALNLWFLKLSRKWTPVIFSAQLIIISSNKTEFCRLTHISKLTRNDFIRPTIITASMNSAEKNSSTYVLKLAITVIMITLMVTGSIPKILQFFSQVFNIKVQTCTVIILNCGSNLANIHIAFTCRWCFYFTLCRIFALTHYLFLSCIFSHFLLFRSSLARFYCHQNVTKVFPF